MKYSGVSENEYPNRVLMLLTDAAGPMVKLGKDMIDKYDYKKLLHVLCIAHGMHNIIGTIRSCYPNTDSIVMGVKDIFSKSYSRISTFKTIAPGKNRPPAPVVTRFGTWLAATAYYADENNRKSLIDALTEISNRESKTRRQPHKKPTNDYRKKLKVFVSLFLHLFI